MELPEGIEQGESEPPSAVTHHLSRAERYTIGKTLRKKIPRELHATWNAPSGRPDPVRLVQESDKGRMPALVPLRHGRMVLSPFTFYRGAALNMAEDLASMPSTGALVQCCGDAHLVNFRGFATPERNVIFAINDLDETLPAPWEWDVKRLAASFVLACRENSLSESTARDTVLTCVRSYREHMAEFSGMTSLDRWYFALDAGRLLSTIADPAIRRGAIRGLEKERETSLAEDIFPKLVEGSGHAAVFKEQPPTLFRLRGQRAGKIHPGMLSDFVRYRESLTPACRVMLDHYRLLDAALKVVGVGSVGNRCWVLLLMDGAGDPLFLQVKEARASVLEAYAGKSIYPYDGQRVVNGHRLMQPSSDIFLGWTGGRGGRNYYVRQLRDVKIKFAVQTFGKAEMTIFADWCGWSLALSHARSGDPSVISGYLGKSDAFDKALAAFSVTYADQTEADHAVLKRAVDNGKVRAVFDEPR
ncbi:DUF2252 domain-containing protein [Paraburkholderia sp. BL27I4N3]|uniref:DUF2252 domain-containing protein n=1 Tax=Paraburkholderia sp. BL27I4N3 TaxID=1938805 RepID=UPI001C6F51FB|nr:DUF2252 domain-containing protein [Paraburkholderia sp. BL27I4N3]